MTAGEGGARLLLLLFLLPLLPLLSPLSLSLSPLSLSLLTLLLLLIPRRLSLVARFSAWAQLTQALELSGWRQTTRSKTAKARS